MQKKIFLSIIVVCLFTANVQTEEKIVLTYWRHHYGPECQAIKMLIKKFEQQEKHIKIQFFSFPFGVYATKIVATLASGEGPDIINIHNSWAYGYIKSGLILPLPEKIFPARELQKNFFPLLQSFSRGNIYYGIPIGAANLALFYNEDHFEKAGFTRSPKTWEELVSMAKKLTKKDKRGRRIQTGISLGLPTGQGWNYFVEGVLRQAGCKILTEEKNKVAWNTQKGVDALTWYTNFVKKFDIHSYLFPEDYDCFRLGLSSMMINGSWTIGNLKKNAPKLRYKTAVLPWKDPMHKATYGTFWGNCVTHKATPRKRKAAWKFLKFISSYENMKFWTRKTGELPMRRKVLTDTAFKDKNKLLVPFIEQLDYSYSSLKKDERVYKAAISDAMLEIILNDMAPKQALQQAADRINAMLKRK